MFMLLMLATRRPGGAWQEICQLDTSKPAQIVKYHMSRVSLWGWLGIVVPVESIYWM